MSGIINRMLFKEISKYEEIDIDDELAQCDNCGEYFAPEDLEENDEGSLLCDICMEQALEKGDDYAIRGIRREDFF